MLTTLNGRLPAGSPASTNPPGTLTWAKFLSNTSIRPVALLAAYRNRSEPLVPNANPVYATGAGAPRSGEDRLGRGSGRRNRGWNVRVPAGYGSVQFGKYEGCRTRTAAL